MWTNELFKTSIFGTLKHSKPDSDTLKPISEVTPIGYQKPDLVFTFDKASSVHLSNTNHEEDQPVHLRLRDPDIPIRDNLPRFGEPARLYCPAGVYEVVYANEASQADPHFVINVIICVHCKTCDIKDPAKNIEWICRKGEADQTIWICELGVKLPLSTASERSRRMLHFSARRGQRGFLACHSCLFAN